MDRLTSHIKKKKIIIQHTKESRQKKRKKESLLLYLSKYPPLICLAMVSEKERK